MENLTVVLLVGSRTRVGRRSGRRAALKKQKEEEEAAAVQQQKQLVLERLKNRHFAEVDNLKENQATEAERIRNKHEAQLEALQKRQQKEVEEALKEAEKQLHPADPASQVAADPSAVDSPSPVAVDPSSLVAVGSSSPVVANTPPLSGHRKGTDEMHRDYLSEYAGSKTNSGKGSKRTAEKLKKQEELAKQRDEENLKKQLQEEDLKKQLQEEDLQMKELGRLQEEEAMKRLDKSLIKKSSFVDVAKKAAHDEIERKKEQTSIAQRRADEARQKKVQAVQNLKNDFAGFLKSFIKDGTNPYKRLVKVMKILGDFNLKVEFEDIVQFKTQLGIDLLNDKSRESTLLSVVQEFLGEEAFGHTEEVKWKAQLTVNRLPHSIDSVKVILESKVGLVIKFTNIFGEGHCGSTLAPLTCAMFSGLAAVIFDGHGMGRTWNGNFSIDSMYVVDRCYFVIAIKPQVLPDSASLQFESRKADLTQLVSHFKPHLDCRELGERQGEPDDSDYPVYFPELCSDLEKMTKDDLESSWIRDYVFHHPSLKLPLARHNFVCNTHLLLQSPISATLSSIFSEIPCTDDANDWRIDVFESKIHLLTWVYYYDPLANSEETKGKGKAEGSRKAKSSFTKTTRDIFSYDRNLKQHAPRIVTVKSTSEVEVFSSTKLMKYIHKTIKLLLKQNFMKAEFKDIWYAYKSSSPRTIDGSELKLGRPLSFWN